jgi:putative transposase
VATATQRWEDVICLRDGRRRRALVELQPGWGGPRFHWCLERKELVQNYRRAERRYRLGGLLVRRWHRRRIPQLQVERPMPVQPNERWSLGFVHDRLADVRPICILTVVDDCTRQCPRLTVNYSLASVRVIEARDGLATERPLPARLVRSRGRVRESGVLDRGSPAGDHARLHPALEAYRQRVDESFNGKFRDECLSEQGFLTLGDARMLIERWR